MKRGAPWQTQENSSGRTQLCFAMRYRLNPQYRLFLCLRLEQDTLHWFVCDLDGTPLEQEQQTCSGDVRELLDTLLMRVRARYPRLAAVVP